MADAVSLSDARNGLSDLVNRARFGGERVQLSSRGKPVAVLLSVEDFEGLEALEDAADVRAYDEGKAAYEADGRKTVSLDDVKRDLEADEAAGK